MWAIRNLLGGDVGWGFQMQYPGYVAALATVVFLFGLNLFGVFDPEFNKLMDVDIQFMVDRKLVLRSIINAIIDIRLHTTDWPEEEAVKLMIERGYQEPGEANGKLTRAKLSSVQLATYFAGHRAILEILEEYRAAQGEDFSWKAFNERLVTAGSPPFFALRERMLGPQ